MVDAGALARAFREAGDDIEGSTAARIVDDAQRLGYAEPLLRYLGAQRIDSLDVSDYEGCTIVHDLNQPLPPSLERGYSLVIDGGSLEHVYNFPQAIANCLELVRVGGHFVMVTPANNHLGHGFYQFSPELMYRSMSSRNGYRVLMMLVRNEHRWARWYAVADPANVRHRVQMTSPFPSSLYVIGQRTTAKPVLTDAPPQSDYVSAWQAERGPDNPAGRPRPRSVLLRALIRLSKLRGTRVPPGDFERVSLAQVGRNEGSCRKDKSTL